MCAAGENRSRVTNHFYSLRSKNAKYSRPRLGAQTNGTPPSFDSLYPYRHNEKHYLDGSIFHYVVPRERIELSWVAPHDFESCASTNSATTAIRQVYLSFLNKSIYDIIQE